MSTLARGVDESPSSLSEGSVVLPPCPRPQGYPPTEVRFADGSLYWCDYQDLEVKAPRDWWPGFASSIEHLPREGEIPPSEVGVDYLSSHPGTRMLLLYRNVPKFLDFFCWKKANVGFPPFPFNLHPQKKLCSQAFIPNSLKCISSGEGWGVCLCGRNPRSRALVPSQVVHLLDPVLTQRILVRSFPPRCIYFSLTIRCFMLMGYGSLTSR